MGGGRPSEVDAFIVAGDAKRRRKVGACCARETVRTAPIGTKDAKPLNSVDHESLETQCLDNFDAGEVEISGPMVLLEDDPTGSRHKLGP